MRRREIRRWSVSSGDGGDLFLILIALGVLLRWVSC